VPLPAFLRAFVPPAIKRWKARRQLREHAQRLSALRAADVGFAGLYRASRDSGWYATLQVESEIVGLLERVAAKKCQTLMEIGTASGGTIYLLTRAADRHATIISADLEDDADRWANFPTFALDQQRIVQVTGNSNDPATLKSVHGVLAGRPLDFLLIDGDHSSYGVRQDFALYAPLVAPGGMVVLHDICLEGGVKEFWAELKTTHRCEELVGDPKQVQCGLGIVYV
jgi:predicted O-methyltransferase YrrM